MKGYIIYILIGLAISVAAVALYMKKRNALKAEKDSALGSTTALNKAIATDPKAPVIKNCVIAPC